jgi:hypothetical protein
MKALSGYMAGLGCWLVFASTAVSQPADTKFRSLADEYKRSTRPLIDQFCVDCHDRGTREGELDLERFVGLDAVRKDPAVWQKVVKQLDIGEMPPKTAEQPSEAQRADLIKWTKQYLHAEALAHAGDPGPVVLRRLSNSEYGYTIRDLTGVASLDPVREFPVDGAAGEGFTNTGAALVMSPALLTKYLDAAKEVAAHAVLLPDSIAFSEKTTRRDWTEEKLAAIRAFYSEFADSGEASSLNLQGVKFNSKDAGVIPLEKYLAATLAEREALSSRHQAIDEVARERGLNAKYLRTLWQTLNDTAPSLLLDLVREQWRAARPADAPALVAAIGQWQSALWRFATIGHIGKRHGPQAWQVPVLPLAESQEVRVKLPESVGREDITLYLVSSDAGDGDSQDVVVWERPRIVLPNRPPVLLQDVQSLVQRVEFIMTQELARTTDYLSVLAEAHATKKPIEQVAGRGDLNPALTANWSSLAKLGHSVTPRAAGHYADRLANVGGSAAIRGWGSERTPSLLTNKSDDAISFLTLTVPGRGVTVHPSPDKEAIVYWRSPFDGTIRLEGLVADADNKCGNGVAWRVERITRAGAGKVAEGVIDNGGRESFKPAEELAVKAGDLVRLAVNARERQHACDTTHVALTVKEVGNENRVWDLATDIVDRIHDGNPLADSYGHAGTWHFCASAESPAAQDSVPPGSVLATWRDGVLEGIPEAEVEMAARAVQQALIATESESVPGADESMREKLLDWHGPLNWLAIAADQMQTGSAGANIELTAPSVLEYRLPAKFVGGGEFVTTGKLHPVKGKEGSVQMRALLSKPADAVGLQAGAWTTQGGRRKWTDGERPVVSNMPILVTGDSDARQRITRDMEAFRQIFPAALCYTKIVPVDEVVTLTLFYREDDHLRRLMLSDGQAAELDRLWNELRFVSHEPLKLVDAYEQLWQYATQDADPSAFEPLRKPILKRAAEFRQELAAAEPRHLEAVAEFAQRAWRRPLTAGERDELISFYRQLRGQELPHGPAIRMTLARVLVAPAFLYKLEKPAPGPSPSPVSDPELATRLSYFLWSSTPDDKLMALAAAGELRGPDHLAAQTRRMLDDARVRRLAVEFGCQWLGVRDFDQFDEKSERHFPEFAQLRGAMYEETVRFMTDLFRNDGSILAILDADYTFVDPGLAEFYGFSAPSGAGWQRVEGVRQKGRGGVLGMAATLAKQSGASRTSPILRGNWVYETLLGEHLPRPPKDVPQLPDSVPEGLTERQLIEQHSSAPACAKCHVKIDPYGFALENFDAIGRARTGRDTQARLPGGQEINGLADLRGYLLKDRRADFVRQFCRKLLGYALGRAVQLSDEPLLDAMTAKLAANDYRVSVAIEQIVLSPQFRRIRGKDALAYQANEEEDP